MNTIQKIAADRLAYAVGRCVMNGTLNSRSGPADALLDYLEIGSPDRCQSVPEWLSLYEQADRMRKLAMQAAAPMTERKQDEPQ